jgi:predicted DNA-binding WGR domain protein
MDDERSPIRHALALRRVEPEHGMARFYSLLIERDLFGQVMLVRQWGRMGTRGREIVERFDTELQAGAALEEIARCKRRRGYVDL